MREKDVLANNPRVRVDALEAIHEDVFGWALSRANYDRAAAEDLVQQAYMELMSGKARFDERSSLKTFVFAVVQNLARSRFRRVGLRLSLLERFGTSLEPAPTATIDASLANQDIWQLVRGLPARQRDVIELVFMRDLTVDEASAVMGVSKGTGRVHYDRAKKALRDALDEEDFR